MNSDEESVFLRALDLTSPHDRAAYLDRACGPDVALRERIDALILAYDEGQFLELPAKSLSAKLGLPYPRAIPGTRIGPYKLLEQIGEGGMAVVFVASQREPIRRKVAFKIIKPGMDTCDVVTRFDAQRQALELMDHPNIARVLDAGVTAAGRPYFVTELVSGDPITAYCDRRRLSNRARLELFVDLCRGVQHAHQKGLIHRDLKPGNVLIATCDCQPVLKIIDFGIAESMGWHLTEQSLFNGLGQLVGTPQYMSPEQAGLHKLDVDTRSDIFALGVMLYELLTGHTPVERDTLRTVPVDELRRIIREVDPPRPSKRVSTLEADDLSTISARRHVEPRKLSQQLRGELDWIVMKALDKDRERRYTTANGLAADLERYLHDELVEACPPSAAYRFRVFARRHQAVLVTSALVATASVVGAGVSVWQALRATHAESTAITERHEKEQQALRATNAAQPTAKALLKRLQTEVATQLGGTRPTVESAQERAQVRAKDEETPK